MSEQRESDDWDETVDVLCVGDGPGALAYAVLCATGDLDVLIVESADLDPNTRDWRAMMTVDLADGAPEATLAPVRAELVPERTITDRTRLEPFVGEHLRRWSAHCLASPFGVMFSHVADLEPMRTADGESITAGVVGSYRCDGRPPGPALLHWLRERATELFAPADDRLDDVIIADGRIAGVVLNTADGLRRVGVTDGLALSIGTMPQQWPDQPELDGRTFDVAVLGRTAGRFGTVGLLQR